jgi:hypothetical protein
VASIAFPTIPEEPAVVPAAGGPRSAVSWAAVIAGAVVASAASLVLLILGSGLGLAMASPWSAPSATSFTVMAGVWFIIIQWAASAVGGYITGRLRTRWTDLHTHEVFFRDTAHGFLAWSLSTVLVAALLISAGSSALGGASREAGAGSDAYALDALFRSPLTDSAASAPTRAEAARILARATANGGLTADDRRYLGGVVAARTGVSAAEAEARVDDAVTAVKSAADSARKAASATALFTALAMVIGAFIASVAAALGGQLRNEHP